MLLPLNRYLDYYLVISEVEFLIELSPYKYTLKRKHVKFNPENVIVATNDIQYKDIFALTIPIYEAILNNIYGLKNPNFQRYLYQHSIHYHPEISENWYHSFYENPYCLLTFLKENLRFLKIDSKNYNLYLTKFKKTLEIIQLEFTRSNVYHYDFEATITYQNIEDVSECYSFILVFNQRRIYAKSLDYAIKWHNKQQEKKKKVSDNI